MKIPHFYDDNRWLLYTFSFLLLLYIISHVAGRQPLGQGLIAVFRN